MLKAIRLSFMKELKCANHRFDIAMKWAIKDTSKQSNEFKKMFVTRFF